VPAEPELANFGFKTGDGKSSNPQAKCNDARLPSLAESLLLGPKWSAPRIATRSELGNTRR
jgi:hypothetical protein